MRTVTEAAAIKRINRKLAHDGERLRQARTQYAGQQLGRFWIESDGRLVIASHCELERLGREIGVLRADERVVDDQGGAA